MRDYRRALAALRPPADRDEPCRLRPSGGALRARAGPARRPFAGGGAVGQGYRAPRRRRAAARARRPSSPRRSSRRSWRETVAREAGVETAVLDPLEGLCDDALGRRRRLLHRHARESRRAAKGARMHELSEAQPSSSSTPSRSATARASACSRTSHSTSAPVSSSRSPARTAAARRRCSGSCSGSSDRRRARCASSASPREERRRGTHRVSPAAIPPGRRGPRDRARGRLDRASRTVGNLGAAASIRPCGRGRGDRDGGARRPGGCAVADAVGRDAAARADREGARLRADPPRSRRADDRRRRRLSGVTRAPPRGAEGELGVTILYVSHEFGAVEHVVDRIVLVRGGIVYDGPPQGLPGVWHDPSPPHHHA